MRCYINGTLNKDLQVGIYLYQALKISFIPIVSAPWFIV